jgi:chromate transporter
MSDDAGDAPSKGTRPLSEVGGLFLQLGVTGFGGPMAHIAMMEREAVEKRAWLTRQRFLDALAATNLIPGPNSTEMAIHIGHLRARLGGALLAGGAFILPAFLLMLLLSWLYFRYQTTPLLIDLFYGVKPAVIALILLTVYRLFFAGVAEPRAALRGQLEAPLLLLFGAGLAITYLAPGYEVGVILGAGLIGLVVYGPRPALPRRFRRLPAVVVLATAPAFVWEPGVLADLFLVCLRTGALLFGGGYVMIPLLENDVVDRSGWLSREAFLDGVALGQVTPGPIVITAAFVGYAAAGLAGACVATFAIFAPSFPFAVLASRFVAAFGEAAPVRAALKGISAAVVGAILATTLRLAENAFPDAWTAAMAVLSLVVLWRFRIHAGFVFAAAALAGLAIAAA